MLTAFSGPTVVYGERGTGVNPDLAPSLVAGTQAWIDPRVSYNDARTGAIGSGIEFRRVLASAPSALSNVNIAAAAHVVTGTAMTLVSATGSGVVVLTTALKVWGSGNTIPVGAVTLDTIPGLISYGLANKQGNVKTSIYDPAYASARAVSITGVAAGAGGAFLVSGYDLYGYAMSETITAPAGAATTNGKKAFKFVTSVVPQFTDPQNYSVGTADVFGFPIAASAFDSVMVWWNSALITAATGFLAADATTATATTGDTRGTYAVQSAADGTKRLVMAVAPVINTVMTAVGNFGVTQA